MPPALFLFGNQERRNGLELIKEIGKRKNTNGQAKKWGLFECPECKQEVERRLGAGKRQTCCSPKCSNDYSFRNKHLNKIYGTLRIVNSAGFAENKKHRLVLIECVEHGDSFVAHLENVIKGRTAGCPKCRASKVSASSRRMFGKKCHHYKHGLSKTKAYKSWVNMQQRARHKKPWCHMEHDQDLLNSFVVFWNLRCEAGFDDPDEKVSPHRIDESLGYTIDNIEFLSIEDHSLEHAHQWGDDRVMGEERIGQQVTGVFLTEQEIKTICQMFENNKTMPDIASELNIPLSTIRGITNGATHQDITVPWREKYEASRGSISARA